MREMRILWHEARLKVLYIPGRPGSRWSTCSTLSSLTQLGLTLNKIYFVPKFKYNIEQTLKSWFVLGKWGTLRSTVNYISLSKLY